VGPSASGKTTLINEFKKANFSIMEENYMGSFNKLVNNREMLSKWNWISFWFDRILNFFEDGLEILITDSHPLLVVPFVDKGTSLIEPILYSQEELKHHNILIETIYLNIDFEVLMKRVYARIEHEQHRRYYAETDIEFCKKIYDFYEIDFNEIWTYIINVHDKNPRFIMQEIIDTIGIQTDANR
jgi:GTPase SAR1 family protein